MEHKTVSILGCGWLGLPLARQLLKRGYTVKGSTTTPQKLETLKELRIEPFLIDCSPELNGKRVKFFFLSNTLFLDIPFRRDLPDPAFYREQIESVLSYVYTSPIQFIVFASSTAVYPESCVYAMEGEVFHPDNPRAKILHDIEQHLLGHDQFQTTIIRFGGLYGPQRKIGGFMAGKKGVSEGEKPVNLIHLDDAVHITARVITKDVRGEIFNAVSDKHPTRKRLYTRMAIKEGLEPPEFLEEPVRTYKIVTNDKVKQRLGYVFQHPDPLKE